MEIKGRLVRILPAQTGQGRNGEWKKQGFVIETEGTYPKKVHFQVWNDKVNVGSFATESMINVFFDPESREFQEKWYTDLTAWKVDTADGSIQNIPPMPPIETYQPDMDVPPVKDDLPF
jgi:hypothetical protein